MVYTFDIDERFSGTVSNRCKVKVVDDVFDSLDDEHQDLFMDSCFRQLLLIKDIKLASQVVHQLVRRTIKTPDKNEVWFKIQDKLTRFGLQEFTLVTGFKATDEMGELEVLKGKSPLLQRFKNKKGQIHRNDLLTEFNRCDTKKEPDVKYKLGLLTILEYVVLATECDTLVNERWFSLVEDLDKFNSYPWGNLSYGHTIKVFKRNAISMNEETKKVTYSVHGFPLAIMIWAFEAIPEFGKKFGATVSPFYRLPRMIGWTMKKQLQSEHINLFFKDTEVEVRRTLMPNSDEAEASYFRELRMVGDGKVDSSDNELEDKGPEPLNEDVPTTSACHDQSNPPQPQGPLGANNVAQIVREVVKDELRVFRVEMEMKMATFLESIKRIISQSNGSSSGRATCDDAKVNEGKSYPEMEEDNTFRDTEVADENADRVECNTDTVTVLPSTTKVYRRKEREFILGNLESKMHTVLDTPEKPMRDGQVADEKKAGVEDEEDGDVKHKGDDALVEESPMVTGKHSLDVHEGIVTNPSSAIVPYQRWKLWSMEIEKNAVNLENFANATEFAIITTPDNTMEQERDIAVEPIEIGSGKSESAKGKGHRTKRKAAILCSPWINPRKRRRFRNVTSYDPLRPVDPAKVDDFEKWLSSAPDGDEVELPTGDDASKAWFKDLIRVDGWLRGEHVDAALHNIRVRATTFPILFRQDCTILDSNFVPYVRIYFGKKSNSKSSEPPQLDKALVNYVKGNIPRFSRPWSTCTTLYVPFCNEDKDHWLALEIDLPGRRIYAYDSLPSIMRQSQLQREMKPLQDVLPLLMRLALGDGDYSTKEFSMQRVKAPGQTNGSDCGMFTIKYIEFLQARLDVKGVSAKYMPDWRKKLAAEIFASHFDP